MILSRAFVRPQAGQPVFWLVHGATATLTQQYYNIGLIADR